MKQLPSRPVFAGARALGLAGVAAVTLAACVSPAEQSIADAQQDQRVCAAMGASYGTTAHTQCMLQQQQRRDQEQLIFLEQARISQETAQMAQEMRERGQK